MPGSSPIEELTAALSDIERALVRMTNTPALSNSRQPISEAATIVSQQIRAMAELFQKPQATIADTTAVPVRAQAPPGFTWADMGPPRSPAQQLYSVPLWRVPAMSVPVVNMHVPPPFQTGATQPLQAPLQRVPIGNHLQPPIPAADPVQDTSIHLSVDRICFD